MPLSRSAPISATVALLAASLVVAQPALQPAADASGGHHRAGRAAASISVTGRGYGHGHGLSQYGAEGAARKGLSARQILAFYYPGLKHGTARGDVSVLISADTTPDVVVSDRPGLRVTGLGNHHRYRLTTKGATQWRLTATDGGDRTTVSYRKGGRPWAELRTVKGEGQVDAGGAPVTLRLPHGVQVAYRGALRSAASDASGSRRDTVNVVPLEGYLRGVVPREAFPSWHAAALQAQAVAARTYAAFERRRPLSRSYQICDTSACQVYGGYSSEVATTSRAVEATRRQVLTKRGEPAFTQFSASNGGYLAAGGEPYLVAKKDPYDRVYRGWKASVSAAEVERAFPALGRFRAATVLDGDGHGQWKGRVTHVRLTGSAASTVVTGDTFRSVFALMSTWFTFT